MQVVGAVVGFFENLGAKAYDVASSIGTFFSDTWNAIASTAQAVWDTITGIFTTVGQIWLAVNLVIIEGILNLFGTSLAEVVTTVIAIWENVKLFTSTAWEAITVVLSTAWNAIKLVFTTAGSIVKSTFSALWESLKTTASVAWEALKGIVKGMWDGMTSMFSKGIESASQAWTNFAGGLSNIMSATWQNIKNTIAAGINWIIDKANAIIRSINTVTGKVGFTISEIPRVAFQTGGIVPGGANPASHDKVYAALDPGELILNRAQQSNIANQLESGGAGGGGVQLTIHVTGNTFQGLDDRFAEEVGDMIFARAQKHFALPSF